ncbi:MAG: hypothetical protein Q9221_004497 [Calogaya cf. arnoldii]
MPKESAQAAYKHQGDSHTKQQLDNLRAEFEQAKVDRKALKTPVNRTAVKARKVEEVPALVIKAAEDSTRRDVQSTTQHLDNERQEQRSTAPDDSSLADEFDNLIDDNDMDEAMASFVDKKREQAKQVARKAQAAEAALAERQRLAREAQAAKVARAEQQRVNEQRAAREKEAQAAAQREENAKKAEDLAKEFAAEEIEQYIDLDCELTEDEPSNDGFEFEEEDINVADSNDRDEWSNILLAIRDGKVPEIPVDELPTRRCQGIARIDTEVLINPIAAVIVGIAEEGLRLGITSDMVQQVARNGPCDNLLWPCLKSPDKMWVPMYFSSRVACENADNQGYINPDLPKPQEPTHSAGAEHWLLVVAVRQEQTVYLDVFNSLMPGSKFSDPVRIDRVARTVVRNSGWIEDSVRFGPTQWSAAPLQVVPDTCGIHVVVNAWASILKLTIDKDFASDAFYQDARDMMTRAMAGKVTVSEIEAWLYFTGYVIGSPTARDEQADNDPEVSKARQAQTVKIDHEVIERYLRSESPSTSHLDLPPNAIQAQGDANLASTSKPSLVDAQPSSPSALQETSKKRKRTDSSVSESSDSESSDVSSDSDNSRPDDGYKWTTTLRYQAFAKLEREQLKKLIVGTGIDKPVRPDAHGRSKVAAQLAGNTKIRVPTELGDPQSVITMRWPNVSHEDLIKKGVTKLNYEMVRLGVPMPRKTRTEPATMATLLKDYVPRARKRITVKLTQSRWNEWGARASKMGIPVHKGKREIPWVELKEAVEARERRELQRSQLKPDPNLPVIERLETANTLVWLCLRYSGPDEESAKEEDLAMLDQTEEALRSGMILNGLQGAEYQQFIRQIGAKSRLPNSDRHRLHQWLSARKVGSYVVFVLYGLESLTINMDSLGDELADRYPHLTFILLIGESDIQWISSSVLWSSIDWTGVLLNRCTYLSMIYLFLTYFYRLGNCGSTTIPGQSPKVSIIPRNPFAMEDFLGCAELTERGYC